MDLSTNININKDYLDSLYKKVESNKANTSEYELIDSQVYIIIGIKDFILNTIIENNLNSYQDFIDERKRLSNTQNKIEGGVVGVILGAIEVLKNYYK